MRRLPPAPLTASLARSASFTPSFERLEYRKKTLQIALQVLQLQLPIVKVRNCSNCTPPQASPAWRDQGKIADAQALLAPIYAWFTEGFDARPT